MAGKRRKRSTLIWGKRAFFLGRFYIQTVETASLEKLRSHYQLNAGIKTKLKLTVDGLVSGDKYGNFFRQKLPLEFTPLNNITDIIVDEKHESVVYIINKLAETQYEVMVYRFESKEDAEQIAHIFSQLYNKSEFRRYNTVSSKSGGVDSLPGEVTTDTEGENKDSSETNGDSDIHQVWDGEKAKVEETVNDNWTFKSPLTEKEGKGSVRSTLTQASTSRRPSITEPVKLNLPKGNSLEDAVSRRVAKSAEFNTWFDDTGRLMGSSLGDYRATTNKGKHNRKPKRKPLQAVQEHDGTDSESTVDGDRPVRERKRIIGEDIIDRGNNSHANGQAVPREVKQLSSDMSYLRKKMEDHDTIKQYNEKLRESHMSHRSRHSHRRGSTSSTESSIRLTPQQLDEIIHTYGGVVKMSTGGKRNPKRVVVSHHPALQGHINQSFYSGSRSLPSTTTKLDANFADDGPIYGVPVHRPQVTQSTQRRGRSPTKRTPNMAYVNNPTIVRSEHGIPTNFSRAKPLVIRSKSNESHHRSKLLDNGGFAGASYGIVQPKSHVFKYYKPAPPQYVLLYPDTRRSNSASRYELRTKGKGNWMY